MTSRLAFSPLALLLLVNCGSGSAPELVTPLETAASARFLATVVLHLEPNPRYEECTLKGYAGVRRPLVQFVESVTGLGASLNLQIDDAFLVGMAKCEPALDHADTGGLALGAWLAAQPRVEVDAHKEGGNELNADRTAPDNTMYAEVHALLDAVVPNASNVVGGFISVDDAQYARLHDPAGAEGASMSTTRWKPTVLSMAVGLEHHNGDFSLDDLSSGVWRPAGANALFSTDAPGARLPYIGPGLQHTDWGHTCPFGFHDAVDYIPVVLGLLDSGTLPSGVYTTSIAVPESALQSQPDDPNGKWGRALALIAGVNALASDDSRLGWATYSGVANLWATYFASKPTRLALSDIPAASHTCTP